MGDRNLHFVILKKVLVVTAMAGVSACEKPAIWGSGDSLTNRLEIGMSPNAVSAIIGNPTFLDISDAEPALICRSYVYDETIDAKFVHVMFRDDKLVSARDGFRTACAV